MRPETLCNIVGGIYIAILDAIGPRAAAEANETLLAFADDSFTDPAAAEVYRDFVDSIEEAGRVEAPQQTWLEQLVAV